MNYLRLRILISIAIVSAGLIFCSKTPREKEKTRYRKDIKSTLQKIDKSITSIKKESKEIISETKEELNVKIDQLEKAQKALSKELNEMQSATEQQWTQQKAHIDSIIQVVEEIDSLSKRRSKNIIQPADTIKKTS